MLRTGTKAAAASFSLMLICLAPVALSAQGQEPEYLRDRGPGIRMSMLGTYIREGELLVYPFFEWYADHNLEYKPEELGYASGVDYRGRFRASEGILFLAYGLGPNLSLIHI